MKIYTRIILDKDDNVIKQNYFDYDGPLSYCGSGGGGNGNDSDSGGQVTYTGTTSSVDYSAMDAEAQREADLAATHAETYSPPAATDYTGDNEEDVAMETQHYQDWKSETQTPQYSGTEDNEEQAEIDREFAIKKGLKTELSDGSLIDGPNARNSEGIIVDRNDPSIRSQDLTFKEHWDNAPEILKYSPTLRLLYAGGKNIGEWARSKGWNWDSTTHKVRYGDGNEVSESDMQRATASEAPHIIGGTTQQSSQAAQWYANLGSGNTSPGAFDLTTQYAKAKSAVSQRLKSTSSVGQIAVSNSAFFDFLKDNSLNKGIL